MSAPDEETYGLPPEQVAELRRWQEWHRKREEFRAALGSFQDRIPEDLRLFLEALGPPEGEPDPA